MIEISNNKEKDIIFEIQLSGITPQDLTGYFRMDIDGIEYGFKGEISENSITVFVPSLKNIIHRPLREGEKIKSKLEVFGNEHYSLAWNDSVVIKSSIMVEAKVVENKNSIHGKKPQIKASVFSEDKKVIRSPNKVEAPVKKLDSIKITKEHLIKLMEKMGTKDKKIQEIILEKCIANVGNNGKKLFTEIYNYYKRGSK